MLWKKTRTRRTTRCIPGSVDDIRTVTSDKSIVSLSDFWAYLLLLLFTVGQVTVLFYSFLFFFYTSLLLQQTCKVCSSAGILLYTPHMSERVRAPWNLIGGKVLNNNNSSVHQQTYTEQV